MNQRLKTFVFAFFRESAEESVAVVTDVTIEDT